MYRPGRNYGPGGIQQIRFVALRLYENLTFVGMILTTYMLRIDVLAQGKGVYLRTFRPGRTARFS